MELKYKSFTGIPFFWICTPGSFILKKIKGLSLLCFLLFSFCATAQQQGQALVDSLTDVLRNSRTEGSTKARVLNRLGKAYLNISDFTNAAKYLFESLEIARTLKNDLLEADCYSNIGVISFYHQEYDNTITYRLKAMAIYEKRNMVAEKGTAIKSIGDAWLKKNDSAKALSYYNEAIKLFKQSSDKIGEASVYSNKSILYNTDYENKILMALEAQKIWDKESPYHPVSIINTGNIGVAYLDIVRFDSLHKVKNSSLIPAGRNLLLNIAETYFKKAIAMSQHNNDVENEAYFTGLLAEEQEQKGDYKNAYYNFRKYQDGMDSIYSQENKNSIAKIESQREIDIRNKEIELNKLTIASQQKLRIGLIAGIGLLTIIGTLLYWQNRTRKKTNTTLLQLNNELEEANKIKAKFFAILSHDLRSPVANLINFLHLQKEEPGLFNVQQVQAHQQKISSSAEGLLETMESMLLWSKGQMESFKPEIKSIPVSSLFEYLEKFFADTENIAIHFGDANGLIVNTDENYLRTIMQNLTANAVKALKNKPGAVIYWQVRKENDIIILSVTDNGPGISDEQAKALNEGIVVGSSKYGLGFHLIRDLAKAIFATVSFQSKQGAGTTFILSIK